MTIWKFNFETIDSFSLDMPILSEILTVQIQNNSPCIWAKVYPENIKIKRYFRVFGTGHTMNELEDLEYIGTYQMMGGNLVFHLFEYHKL